MDQPKKTLRRERAELGTVLEDLGNQLEALELPKNKPGSNA